MHDTDYRQLVESSPDGLAIHCQGNIVFINQAGARLLGAANLEQLAGQPIINFVQPDERDLAAQRDQQAAQGMTLPLLEERFIRFDGQVVDVEVARFPYIYQGQPAVQLVFHDITSRKRVEAEIIRRNRELTILQSTGVAITSSLDLRHVLDTVVHEMAGLFEVESCSLFEGSEAEETLVLIARYDPAGWWGPQLPAKARHLPDYPLTKWVLDEQIPYQMTVSQTNLDPAELVYMQEGGLKARLLLPMVFQQLVIGLVELEDSRHERTFTYQEISLAKLLANQAASAIQNARLFAQAQQEIAERKRAEAALAEERALLAQRVTERTAELSRTNAELARAARLKDEFLAGMSHELRTPLSGILGTSEILRTAVFGPLNEKQLHYLHNIEESGNHLLSLITDILDLAKSEAGKLELEIRSIAVEPVCQVSLRLTRELAHKKRLKVVQTFDKAVTSISADERRLKQILVNLLSNAIKFTPEGGQIGLEMAGDTEQRAVHFTVWDTGIGIAQEDMKWLFQPFVQIHADQQQASGGTGLGLSLVARMVEMHGGGIRVESKVGQGSRFTVSLPWSPAEMQTQPVIVEDKGEAIPLPSHPAAVAGESTLILLAEDNENNISILTDFLQVQGYRLVVARNGQEALERAHEERPAVVLMDIQMPGMDGLEATRRLRAEPALADLPIIAVTALAMPGDRERCLAAGVNEYLSKPVNLTELVRLIQNQLNRN